MGYCPSTCEKQRAENAAGGDVTGSIKRPPTPTGAKSRP